LISTNNFLATCFFIYQTNRWWFHITCLYSKYGSLCFYKRKCRTL